MGRNKYSGMCGDFIHYNPEEKELNISHYITYMLNRTRRMFKWNNLPETIPERNLELLLQTTGHVCVTSVNGSLYAFHGFPGGEPDAYYMPTIYTVANPFLKFNKNLKIGDECIVVRNDTSYMGLMPLLNRYCTFLAENDLTMYDIDVLARSALVFRADDERDRQTAQEYIDNLKSGRLSVITSDKLLGADSVDVQPGATQSASVITHLIELQQYYKASLFNDLGLNANWNAKRETITSSETLLNSDTLLPLIDDMLFNRQEACEKINDMYGTNISCSYASAWEDNAEEIEVTQEIMENQAEGMNNPNEDLPDNEVKDELPEA